jgi:hypothetical protein
MLAKIYHPQLGKNIKVFETPKERHSAESIILMNFDVSFTIHTAADDVILKFPTRAYMCLSLKGIWSKVRREFSFSPLFFNIEWTDDNVKIDEGSQC